MRKVKFSFLGKNNGTQQKMIKEWILSIFGAFKKVKVKLVKIDKGLIWKALPNNSKSIKRGGVIYLEKKYNQYTIDEDYKSCSLTEFKELLKKDFTNWKIYHKDYDCDNFAFKLYHNLKEKHPMLSVGIVFSTSHAFNVFIDKDGTAHYIEPQTDKIYSFKQLTKKYLPFSLVII